MPFGKKKMQLTPTMDYDQEEENITTATTKSMSDMKAKFANQQSGGFSQELALQRVRDDGIAELEWLNTLKAKDPYYMNKKLQEDNAKREAEWQEDFSALKYKPSRDFDLQKLRMMKRPDRQIEIERLNKNYTVSRGRGGTYSTVKGFTGGLGPGDGSGSGPTSAGPGISV